MKRAKLLEVSQQFADPHDDKEIIFVHLKTIFFPSCGLANWSDTTNSFAPQQLMFLQFMCDA